MNPTITAHYSAESGHIGYVGGAKTARFRFTTPDTGATSLSFRTADFSLTEPLDNSGYATASLFRFALSESASAYEGKASQAGSPCAAQSGSALSGSLTRNLLPGTTYYLFLFPSGPSYCDWYIRSCTVSLSGVYGAASAVSAEDGAFGHPLTVRLSRSLNGVTHTVTAACAGRTETLLDRGEDYPTLSWTPDLSAYAAALPDAAQAPAELRCETFLGGASLGVKTCTVTLRFLPEDAAPAPQSGWAALEPVNEGAAASLTGFIRGFSRARAVFDRTKLGLRLGASLASLSLKEAEEELTAEPYQTALLAGETLLRCTVTDSRGLSASEEFTVSPLEWTPPVLSALRAYRCRTDGTADEGGSCVAVRCEGSCSSLDGQNRLSLHVAGRALGGSFGAETALQSGETKVLTGFSPDLSCELRFTAADLLGESTSLLRLPTRQWALKFRADGQGVAFGKAPETARALELPGDWTLRFGTESWLEKVYPVGSLYLSAADTDPGTLFGGTWARIRDRFLLAAGEGYAPGSTGGEAAHVLSLAELPAETVPLQADFTGTPRQVQLYNSNAGSGSAWPVATYGENGVVPVTTAPLGQGEAHNNLPPYLAVYVWQRTA